MEKVTGKGAVLRISGGVELGRTFSKPDPKKEKKSDRRYM